MRESVELASRSFARLAGYLHAHWLAKRVASSHYISSSSSSSSRVSVDENKKEDEDKLASSKKTMALELSRRSLVQTF